MISLRLVLKVKALAMVDYGRRENRVRRERERERERERRGGVLSISGLQIGLKPKLKWDPLSFFAFHFYRMKRELAYHCH